MGGSTSRVIAPADGDGEDEFGSLGGLGNLRGLGSHSGHSGHNDLTLAPRPRGLAARLERLESFVRMSMALRSGPPAGGCPPVLSSEAVLSPENIPCGLESLVAVVVLPLDVGLSSEVVIPLEVILPPEVSLSPEAEE